MRIPNLNVSESVTQRIRELDLQRIKLDKQISTGQKITLPEDDGLRMSRVIKLDSQKGKLAQFQRNSSYATEFLNAGHLNLEQLREINQRSQEVARLSSSNLNGPAIEAYGYELNELVEEALNRINATHRGKALFGGMALKPEFSHTDVIVGNVEKKTLNLNHQAVGVEVVPGTRYLKQGDEVLFRLNGREYVVQAKVPSAEEYNSTKTYQSGEIVKVLNTVSDSILIDKSKFSDINSVLTHLDQHDWSKESIGKLVESEGSGDVYVLDSSQIQEVAVSLGAQESIDFYPVSGGYFSIREETVDGELKLWLEPVKNNIPNWETSEIYEQGDVVRWGSDIYKSNSDQESGLEFSLDNWTIIQSDAEKMSYRYTSDEKVSYFEATQLSSNRSPELSSSHWQLINPYETASNLSTDKATKILQDLINQDSFFLKDSEVIENDDYTAFVRGSTEGIADHDYDLDLLATISADGSLEVTGNANKSFSGKADYLSFYDSRTYFPNQLDKLVAEKSASLFPGSDIDNLSAAEKDLVWEAVKSEKQTWNLNVAVQNEKTGSTIDIELSKPWKRLQGYSIGQVVEYDDKLWVSQSDENFNHLPTQKDSRFWAEMGSGYSKGREDWVIESSGVETRYFFVTPDGKLFDDKLEAENHTYDILINSSSRTYTDANALFDDISSMVKEIAYPVSKFDVEGSESSALVSFDSASQSYRLASLPDGQTKVSGLYSKGTIKSATDVDLQPSDVIQFGGNYFALLSVEPTETEIENSDVHGTLSSTHSKGTIIYEEILNAQGDVSDRRLYMAMGTELPTESREIVLDNSVSMPLMKGSFVYDRSSEKFYMAKTNISDVRAVNISSDSDLFTALNAHTAVQGAEWSSNQTYFKGQIVLHEGTYFECQTNGKPLQNGQIVGFDNKDDEEFLGSDGDYHRPLVSPSDEFFLDVPDARSQEFLDLQKAKGEKISNNVWLPVSNPIQHILSFSTKNESQADVKIESAGVNGLDAEVTVLTEANGKISGLRVVDSGRYFFPNSDPLNPSIPDTFRKADVVLPDGQSFQAEIIWGQNPNDPGPFIITGFEINPEELLTDEGQSLSSDIPMGPRLGDSYSFATGSKTFLDHRDSEGNIIDVTYTGSQSNSQIHVGKDTKISPFLNAQGGNTAEFAELLDSMVELRNGLGHDDYQYMAQAVQDVERNLINFDDKIVDDMGELSAIMVRMDTVRAHDEDYHIALDQRLANDLDVDMSNAIMRLTQISTAYQAAMQVGANLLNTSLLNYL